MFAGCDGGGRRADVCDRCDGEGNALPNPSQTLVSWSVPEPVDSVRLSGCEWDVREFAEWVEIMAATGGNASRDGLHMRRLFGRGLSRLRGVSPASCWWELRVREGRGAHEISPDLTFGVHAMAVTEGFWDERRFFAFVAVRHLPLKFVTASFYDAKPGVATSGLPLPQTIAHLRAGAVGLWGQPLG